jgi:hypothetical protein
MSRIGACTPPFLSGDDGAGFYCVVSNTRGPVTSRTGNLRLSPTILTQPASTATVAGFPASFTLSAAGPALTYTWLVNGARVAGSPSTAPSLSYTPQASDAGTSLTLVCQVSNAVGTVTSNPATLTVQPTSAGGNRPVILTSPAYTVGSVGSTAYFGVQATGTGLAYAWYNTATGAIPGANGPTYSVTVTVGEWGLLCRFCWWCFPISYWWASEPVRCTHTVPPRSAGVLIGGY